ncbi:uncharacterized protein LOC103130891 isoform X2 [Poecilia formosa]|uniref:uncharacterized protein LOC103130891 isoform X2 n=1 Tax=Poecilia formosa TaxID=48698 RepID=UPI0007B7929B|nr:PREDICTED: uncharacterized protein LOC103130891 isoform X2 [Poecilia formosa]
MKVCLTLICLLFLTLQDGETMETFNRNEGENITVRCEFGYTGTKRFFCKGTCEGRNILVETTEDTDQRGRFSITYEERDIFSTDFLHVSITDLKPSDSGWYQCRSDETWTGTLYYDFYLVVTEASTTSAAITSRRRTTATATTAATQSKSFSPSPSETIKLSEKPAAASGLQLYVVLSLVVKIILLSTSLVIFCMKRRAMNSKGEKTQKHLSFLYENLHLC